MKTFFLPAALRGTGDRLLWAAGWINLLFAAVLIAAVSTVPGVLP